MPNHPETTLCEATALFLDAFFKQSDRSDQTQKAYECDLNQFSEFVGKDLSLASIRPGQCEDWVADLKERGLKPSSRKRKVATLRCFFNECVRRDLLDASPWKGLRFRFSTGTDIPRTLQLSDARAILAEARRAVAANRSGMCRNVNARFLALRNRAIVQLLFSTGIRVGELVALQMEDVQMSNELVLIHGKGGRERIAFLADERVVEAMASYMEARESRATETSAVFLSRHEDAISEQGVSRMLKGLARRAKITNRVTPACCRGAHQSRYEFGP